jgi:hypothetical protein
MGLPSSHALGDEAGIPRHLEIARELVSTVKPENNSYTLHPPNGRGIYWTGDGDAKTNAVHTGCAGFVTGVLLRSHSSLPQAKPRRTNVYFAAAMQGDGLTRVTSIADVEPGDIFIFSCRNGCPASDDVEGHVAFVDVKPYRVSELLGTTKWAVTVIDSARTPHDKSDTRLAQHVTGVGRGTFYVHADSAGTPVGYSTELHPKYFATDVRPIAFGRPLY